MPADFDGVVVAAGRSVRFGGGVPKQFENLAGRTILERAVAALAGRPSVRGVVVVLPADELGGSVAERVRELAGVDRVVGGGQTRADSVRSGLEAAGSAPFVLVHDAARPLASSRLVDAVIEATRRYGAAVPVVGIADTVKRTAGDWIEATLPRERLRLAQTPQGARSRWLRAALERAAREGRPVTDEAAALELDGRRVFVVEGDPANRKITTREDLHRARLELGGPGDGLRVGSGFDIHRFDADRKLRLGGIDFADAPGLAGHSDADVILHAAMDALLGAAGLGDIGTQFPPEDERYSGADSTGLARIVARRIEEAGFRIVNLDLTLLAEIPRIRESVPRMREAIAAGFGTSPDRVGLKATTLERLGALGREEGAACQAVALLERTGGERRGA